MSVVLRRTIPVTTVGAYLVEVREGPQAPALLVGFHGYGESAEAVFAQLRRVASGSGCLVVSVQALHRFYNTKTGDVVGSWMTKLDREQAIADNVRYVASVLDAVQREHEVDGRPVYCGFSQGASMAYRAAARSGRLAHGVIAVGGDVPPDVGEDPEVTLPPVLIGRGQRDEWYSEEKLARDLERLRERAAAVEVARFDGGHEWTDDFVQAARAFLRRVIARHSSD